MDVEEGSIVGVEVGSTVGKEVPSKGATKSPIVCSVYRQRSLRDAFTPVPLLWPFCPRQMWWISS